jgi:hypothetical protein
MRFSTPVPVIPDGPQGRSGIHISGRARGMDPGFPLRCGRDDRGKRIAAV